MACLSLSLLGPFAVTLDGQPVSGFVSDKARALLVYLAVESERPHRRDSLAALLWPDWPDASARSNLRNALANLRAVVGDRDANKVLDDPLHLLITRETIQFDPTSEHRLDVATFRAAIDAEAPGSEQLEAALDLYRGPFLDGFSVEDSEAYEAWTQGVREELERLRLSALERLAGRYEQEGETERAIEAARRQVALAPWQESAHRALMRLLALDGQRSAALVQYETCRRQLAQELGVEPAAETVQLYQDIREGRVGPGERKGPPMQEPGTEPQPSIVPQSSLPRPATPFVGRETQLGEVRTLLARPEVHLLTLTGVGGTGKTRLAIQAAAGLVDEYRDGVYWVPLAPLRDPALVVSTIANALGVRESGETPLLEALKYALRDRERLLVIDNFEQVLEAAPAVGELLAAAPKLKVLATSRALLRVYGEHEYPVPPMEVPYPRALPSLDRLAGSDAVSLFVRAAQRARPGFTLDEGNAAAVAEICARLDGLPLAVELAASRVKLFTPPAMLAHLGEHQGDRLRFLTGGPRDAPARQRALRATIEWSYDLLNEDEQRLFRQLSVFSGGCTLKAVEAVCAGSPSSVVGRLSSSLDLLESLVDQSLLHASRSTPPRFTMLETVREYAWEQLEESGEVEAIRDRHAAYYASALAGWGVDLKGPRQLEAVHELEADLDNARGTWEWAVERGQAEWLDRALEGLCLSYEWRGRYQEGAAACQRTVETLEALVQGTLVGAVDETMMRVLVGALAWQSRLSRNLGESELVDRCLERAASLLDDSRWSGQESVRAFLLLCMAQRAGDTDFEQARQFAERSLALYRALGNRWGMVRASFQLGRVDNEQSDYERMKGRGEECLTLSRELGDHRGIVESLIRMGFAAVHIGQLEEGERMVREALAMARQLGDVGLQIKGIIVLYTALHDEGRFAEALAVREEDLSICRDQGMLVGKIGAMAFLGVTARHQGCYDNAYTWVRAALSLCRESGRRNQLARCCIELGRLSLAEGAYNEAEKWLKKSSDVYEAFGQHWMMGEMQATFAYVARSQGQHARAREHLGVALRITAESRYRNAALQLLPARALLLLDESGRSTPAVERAVELYALAARYPYVANSRWFEDVAGREISAAAGALPPDVVARAQERGQARDLWVTVEELLAELEAT